MITVKEAYENVQKKRKELEQISQFMNERGFELDSERFAYNIDAFLEEVAQYSQKGYTFSHLPNFLGPWPPLFYSDDPPVDMSKFMEPAKQWLEYIGFECEWDSNHFAMGNTGALKVRWCEELNE